MSYVGVIKSFNPQKGYGFIECEETHQVYGKDIFVLMTNLPGRSAQKGQACNFDVVEGETGPQGANVTFQGGFPAQDMSKGRGRSTIGPSNVGPGRHHGVCKSFNPQKGWGFIECEETMNIYGKDMFILKNNIPGGEISKGDQVTFTVAQTATGPHAQEVQLVGQQRGIKRPSSAMAGPGGDGMAPDHIGTVKSFNAQNGWGFLTSPTLMQLYGKDIFFQARDLPFGPVSQGDQLAFSVHQGQKGPVAANLQPFQAMGAYMNFGQQSAPSKGGKGGGSFGGPAWGPPSGKGAGASANGEKKYVGTVKGINPEKAWGHIACQAIFEMCGKDVFLRRTEVEAHGLEVGMMVSFRIAHTPKGPQAEDVMPVPEGTVAADGQDGGVFHGKVKSFNESKGWGFVTSPEVIQIFGKDIFLHKRELGDVAPAANTDVQFSVEQDPKSGQLKAKHVSLIGGPPPAPVIGNPGGYSGIRPRGPSGKGARSSPY